MYSAQTNTHNIKSLHHIGRLEQIHGTHLERNFAGLNVILQNGNKKHADQIHKKYKNFLLLSNSFASAQSAYLCRDRDAASDATLVQKALDEDQRNNADNHGHKYA